MGTIFEPFRMHAPPGRGQALGMRRPASGLDRPALAWPGSWRAGARTLFGAALHLETLVVASGLVVLVGWLLDVGALTGGHPSITPMKPNAALVFVLAGASLFLLRPVEGRRFRRLAGRFCAGAALLIGVLILSEYFAGWDLHIDQLLFNDPSGFVGVAPPGRPGANAAACFALVGAALLLLDVEVKGIRPTEILALGAATIALLRLTGYVYGVTNSEGSVGRWLNPMALNASVTILLLVAATLCARPRTGITGVITSPGVGGIAIRRIVPPIVLGSIVIGWLELEGEQHRVFRIEVGNSLMIVLGALGGSALIVGVARSLDRTASRLAASEERLRRLNLELERRVHERTAEIEALNAELLSANAELEAFSYSVSHDLRAPLRAVDGFTRLLADEHGAALSEGGLHYVDRVLEGVGRMGGLIEGLLSLSRTSRQPLVREPMALAEVVDEVLADAKDELEKRSVEIEIGELPTVSADRTLLKQVLVNLIGNALKFTRGRDPARIEIGSLHRTGSAVIFVRDNGAGFEMRYSDKLFAVFQRLHPATEFEGSGIGLALVKRIVARHGGRVWADSAVGEGATFYFTLGEEPVT